MSRWLVAFALLFVTTRANAYTIETSVTEGCHEKITADALRRVRALAPPVASTEPDDGPLLDDVPFTLPDDMRDIGSTALLLGVRDNDIKNLAAGALDELAEVTADPAGQREHCLRSDTEKEPDGTAKAVEDCRAYIRAQFASALDALGADGKPNPSLRDELEVTLALRGKYTLRLPAFQLRIGRALHALEDSFTHTFRDSSHKKIRVTLDWIDYADNTLDEATDGPPHLAELDRCDDPDDLRAQRHRLAIDAAAGTLTAALDPKLSRADKLAAMEKILDDNVAYENAGCTKANDWCNAPENQYRPSGCGCGARGAGASGAFVAMAIMAAFLARRSKAVPLMLFTPLLFASSAKAQTMPEGTEHEAKGPIAAAQGESQAAVPGTRDPAGSVFAHAAFGASYDKPALAVALGGKYQLSKAWMVGVDAEWNPFIRTAPTKVRSGAGNAYASLVHRFQMAYEPVNIRTTLALGASTLLIDLPGAPKWSVGPMGGISFLGVEWKATRGLYVVIDPAYFYYVVPHVTGVPFGYKQYRFQVGLEFGG